MKRKMILVSLMLIAIFVLPLSNKMPLIISVEIDDRSTILSEYEVHDPILITCNEDFVIQGWPGNGIIENPYVIENLSIDGMRTNSCIAIFRTSAYFVIRNCLLFNASDRNLDAPEDYWNWTTGTVCAGILLYNVTNGEISHNKIVDNLGAGIFPHISHNNTFKSNDLLNNRAGFRLWGSDNNTITNNTIIGGHLEERILDSLVGISMSVWYIWHEPLVDEGNVTYINSEGNTMIGNIFANHTEQNAYVQYCGFYHLPADTWPYNPNKWDDENSVGNFWDDYNSSISDVYNITRTHSDEHGWPVLDYEIDHFPSEYSIPEDEPTVTTTTTSTTTTETTTETTTDDPNNTSTRNGEENISGVAILGIVGIIGIGVIGSIISKHRKKIETISKDAKVLVICPYCGSKTEQGITKCQKCGADL